MHAIAVPWAVFAATTPDPEDRATFYAELEAQLGGLMAGERDWLANLANAAALLGAWLPRINWVGFYLARGGELVVGPFQGQPACVRIALGRGVCGTAAARRQSLLVPDVQAFPGHIRCDAASRSELVIPLVAGARLLGVLDVDSPDLARFDDLDREALERCACALVAACDWPAG
jgi:GAF domain-containing protein